MGERALELLRELLAEAALAALARLVSAPPRRRGAIRGDRASLRDAPRRPEAKDPAEQNALLAQEIARLTAPPARARLSTPDSGHGPHSRRFDRAFAIIRAESRKIRFDARAMSDHVADAATRLQPKGRRSRSTARLVACLRAMSNRSLHRSSASRMTQTSVDPRRRRASKVAAERRGATSSFRARADSLRQAATSVVEPERAASIASAAASRQCDALLSSRTVRHSGEVGAGPMRESRDEDSED